MGFPFGSSAKGQKLKAQCERKLSPIEIWRKKKEQRERANEGFAAELKKQRLDELREEQKGNAKSTETESALVAVLRERFEFEAMSILKDEFVRRFVDNEMSAD